MWGSSSKLHNAEEGEGDVSEKFSTYPSPPTLAALLSLVSIPVTSTSAWAGQWGKEESTTGPNRAMWSRRDQHSCPGYGTRVSLQISLQHLDRCFGGTYTEMVEVKPVALTHHSSATQRPRSSYAAV